MKLSQSVGAMLSLAALACTAGADVIPSGTISAQADGPNFQYTITLTNASASSQPIGTFWFSWVPGKDFMGTSPMDVLSPNGWADKITHGGSTDGYAIQWVAGSGSAIQPGNSLTFSFVSTEAPPTLYGDSPFYPGTSDLTAFVYHAGPFSDSGVKFLLTPVPEPASAGLFALGGLFAPAWLRSRKRKRKA